MLSPRGQSGLEAKILASASKLWPRPRGFGLGLALIFLSYYVIGQRDRGQAEAKTSRPRPELQGRGQNFGLEALWPQGLSITENGPVMLSPRGQSGVEAKIYVAQKATYI